MVEQRCKIEVPFPIRISLCLVVSFWLSAGGVVGVAFSETQNALKGLEKTELIQVDELRQMQLKSAAILLLDARSRRSYNSGHIEGAVLPLPPEYYRQDELFRNKVVKTPPDRVAALEQAMQKYPKDTEIVTYCNRDCSASAMLLLDLQKLGFAKVRAMEDGLQAWEEKGYPVVEGVTGLSSDLIK